MDDAVIGTPKTSATYDLNSYLSSPIRTLCESLNDPEHLYISNHDIVEAYNVLCLRIRSRKEVVSRSQEPGILFVLKENSKALEQCITRDIRRVLYTPVDSQFHRGDPSFNVSYQFEFLGGAALPDVVENMLCQYAIRLLSDLFVFPGLYSKFSHVQLSTMFQDAVSLCTQRASHIYDIERLRCMVLLMLRTQQLSLPILRSGGAVLVDALGCAIMNGQGITVGKLDAFRAIQSILKKYPDLLLSFAPLLALMLNQLNAAIIDIRLEALVGIAAFAITKFDSVFRPHHELAEAVETYLRQEYEHSKRDQFTSLPMIVKSALANNDRQIWQRKGIGFAVSLVSKLLVLLDYRIFINPRALKLVFSVITEAAGRRWLHTGAHTEMWKILIWAFDRLPRKEKDMEDIMAQIQSLNRWKDTREKAFRVVRQELKNGLGLALLVVLLQSTPDGARDADDVEKAVGVLEEMLMSEDEGMLHDVVVSLQSMLSGIGVQSQEKAEWKGVTVGFAKELIDGSMIGKTLPELTFQITKISLQAIKPLSEEEATVFWDRLSAIWVSIAQDLLVNAGDDFPLNMIEIWQALLLVRGQLTESHQHLTAPHLFASRVAAIMTGFSVPLDTPKAQASYLNMISRLWIVVKNVFTRVWLSSPAERILASLLKKHFDLSDETVKDHWSQICAELVSVGVPTLLHVLHTRTSSPSQEEKEVTRHLWSVLAESDEQLSSDGKRDGPHVPGGDWMEFVHLLVMPFGAWDMDNSEMRTWEATFSRAIMAGSKVSKQNYEVISVMLDILGDSKLRLLKNTPKVLKTLLSQLVSAPCTTATHRLLHVTDDFLRSLYSRDPDNNALGLEFLHLIGSFVARFSISDITELVTDMPNGLCKWIADEDSILTEDKHQNIVISIYSTALEKLSRVEPSIDCLHILADFLHSGFVRIQPHALVSFQKFWRATYHQRKDIPRMNYPVAIKACLKAWGDVCNDSLADDLSLDPDSQSLESFTISDSQPSPVKKHQHEADISALGEVNFNPSVSLSKNDGDIASTTSTPKARKAVLPLPPAVVLPEGVQAFPSQHSHSTSSAKCVVVSSLAEHNSPRSNLPSKRPLDSKTLQSSKRRRLHSEVPFRIARLEEGSSGRSRQVSVSEPVTRTSSLSLPPPFWSSQPLERQPHKRSQDETTFRPGGDLEKLKEDVEADEEADDKGEIPSDDYDKWERGMVSIQREDEEHVEDDDLTDHVSEDPSLGQFLVHSRRRDRSQTAPEFSVLPESESILIPQAGQSLRRHQSSPLEHTSRRKGSSAQLDALQKAYAIISDTGTSQIDVKDIMHARRLANQINQVLDEQMCLKFGAHPDNVPDPA